MAENYVPGTTIEKPVCKLVGEDGNAFAIMGRVIKSLERAGVPRAIIDAYKTESMSGDYNHLLQTATRYVRDQEGA